MTPKPSIAIILDTRKALQSGKYHIKLRVTFTVYTDGKKKWIPQYYKTGVHVTKEEFESIKGNPRTFELKKIKSQLVEFEAKAESILKLNSSPSISSFERLFMETGSLETIAGMFDRYSKNLSEKGRISSAGLYDLAKKSFINLSGSNLTFLDITPEWLSEYETKMIEGGKSINTIGIYLRCLRSIFNQAISLNVIPSSCYPFGRFKFKIPTSTRRQIALSKENKNLFIEYKTDNASIQRALDFWMLSYYCYGLNFTDIAMLKNSNIHGDTIILYRQKTINTERNKTELSIPITPEVNRIINKYRTKDLSPNSYVFDVLEIGLSPTEVKARTRQFIKTTNKFLKRISDDLGFKTKVTTYTARHTFATMLRDAGVSTNFIQKLLDHQSQTTTEKYFASLDMQEKLKIVAHL